MQANRFATGLGAVIALSGWVLLEAGQLPPGASSSQAPPLPQQATRLPLAPTGDRGTTVTPGLEGWFRNDDGTVTFLVGYMNRNTTQTFEIPIGPNNHIDPGGPDYGQPTFFEAGRQVGVFTVTVPKDFGTKRLTWTLVANGQPQAITLWINQPYVIAPFVRADNGNSPPVVKFAPAGSELTGPPRGIAQTLTTTGSEPVALAFWVSDKGNTVDQQNQFGPPISAPPPPDPSAAAADGAARGAGRGRGGAGRGGPPADPQAADAAAGAPPDAAARGAGGRGGAAAGGGGGRGGFGGRGGPPVRVRWVKHRGPGTVTFANPTPPVVAETMAFSKPGDIVGKVSTTATFSAPGEYVLRGQVNDTSGQSDGCCWTNVHVKVTVKPAAAAK